MMEFILFFVYKQNDLVYHDAKPQNAIPYISIYIIRVKIIIHVDLWLFKLFLSINYN